MSEYNPYRTPEAAVDVEPTPPGSISRARYSVNVGCALGILLVWIPTALMSTYQLVMERTAPTIESVCFSALLLGGCVHSIIWAVKKRRTMPRVVVAGTNEADRANEAYKERRRTFGY